MAECSVYDTQNTPCPIPYDLILKGVCAKYPPGFAFAAVDIDGTNMNGLAKAWALSVQEVLDRACELLPEFQCGTTSELVPEWNDDYGLPDDCGIDDLCAKVGATGGADCSYFKDLARLLGYYDTCCEDIPPEITPGCWNMGCGQMPPQPVLEKGGSSLGFHSLGCEEVPCGSPLGQATLGTDGCNVAGYRICEEVATTTSACSVEEICSEYHRPSTGTLIAGCYEAYNYDNYTGTAYNWRFGVPSDLASLGIGGVPAKCQLNDGICDDETTDDPAWCVGETPLGTFIPPITGDTGAYSIMGCWETGCTELCAPPTPSLLCFIGQYKPAHTIVSAYDCNTRDALNFADFESVLSSNVILSDGTEIPYVRG